MEEVRNNEVRRREAYGRKNEIEQRGKKERLEGSDGGRKERVKASKDYFSRPTVVVTGRVFFLRYSY